MTVEPTPGGGPWTEHDGPPDPVREHVPSATIRPLKALGIVGYIALLLAIALLAVTIAAAALDMMLAPWIAATVVCGIIGIGALVFARTRLVATRALDRPGHDPIVPEVSAEEAAEYESEFHAARPQSDNT